MTGRTLFDKIWDEHVVEIGGAGWDLLHIDRHLVHDLSGPPALARLEGRGLTVQHPELTFATPDHAISSAPGRTGNTNRQGASLWSALKRRTQEAGVRFFDIGERGQGIVHVMAPELGLTLPGLTLVCGDSHTCTNGGLGALAFGIGSTEITHVFATQTIRQRRPKRMRINFTGHLEPGVFAKDLVLFVIAKLGAAGAAGHALEFAGPAIAGLDIEGRMTICNLAVEMGAKMALVQPDDVTFAYIEGRPFAPEGRAFERAVSHWRTLHSDDDAVFEREHEIDASVVPPMVTWGISPDHALPVDGVVPDPAEAQDLNRREAWTSALEYMHLKPGQHLDGLPVDWVFIGSCANSRISDLREAAKVLGGRRVAEGVTAWIVPGSEEVKRQAEAEGLRDMFLDAGFQWREPGCSMCVAANGERIPEGARVASTSNRNFIGRQGPGARTHLTSPAMAAAAAIKGTITDVRKL